MAKLKFKTYVLPAYWASALINSDMSGLKESEIQEILKFLKDNPEILTVVDCAEESYFSKYNDAGTLAGEVLDYICQVKESSSPL